ncbi:MAG: carboxypeptidase-like regulatory domain-containing protein, partial [Bacteroidetes bacterium]|nr:carboxypeptidase-like regulatory domain-containing protein [Bacteroidota bacterium]
MRIHSYILISILFISFNGFGQEKPKNYTLSGFINDAQSGESLIAANIYVKDNLRLGTSSNVYGFYSLTLPMDTYTIVVQYLGYATKEYEMVLDRNIRLNVDLASTAIVTKEVVITGERPDKNIESTEMGKVDLSIEKIKTIPVLFGEVDILKTIQLLPGVQSSGEGNTGFYVRGGGPDQNLILLDEAVVYNPGHLFGFFSVFNADAIKNVTLIKGGIPANYGGRLSSVLDISMKEGNDKSYHGEGGIGIIASRLTFEGPI